MRAVSARPAECYPLLCYHVFEVCRFSTQRLQTLCFFFHAASLCEPHNERARNAASAGRYLNFNPICFYVCEQIDSTEGLSFASIMWDLMSTVTGTWLTEGSAALRKNGILKEKSCSSYCSSSWQVAPNPSILIPAVTETPWQCGVTALCVIYAHPSDRLFYYKYIVTVNNQLVSNWNPEDGEV